MEGAPVRNVYASKHFRNRLTILDKRVHQQNAAERRAGCLGCSCRWACPARFFFPAGLNRSANDARLLVNVLIRGAMFAFLEGRRDHLPFSAAR